jgi:predicted TIM-barrel fold metal-dependent hydrolase
MRIDTHVHVWQLDDQHRPAPNAAIRPPAKAAPVEWLLEDMANYHLDHCVLVQSSAFGWDNTYMVECLEHYPGTFKAIGLVDPVSPHNAADLRLWMSRGLSGVRLHPVYFPEGATWIDAAANDALWNVAADTGAILQFHMRPEHAAAVGRMAHRHPAVRVIIDHIGKPDVAEPPPYPSFQTVLALSDHSNIWMKIGDYQIASKLAYPWRDTFPFVAMLKGAFGAQRMLWGTGYPTTARLVPLQQALDYVTKDLPCFSPAEVDLVMGNAAAPLFGF